MEVKKMSQVLYNPTNEYMEYYHAGIRYGFKPGDKIKVHDKAANHLLVHMFGRGLTSLDYGDEGRLEEIEKEALERNKEFKKKQVIQYNVLNENRKLSGQGYLPPSKKVKEYALELGIELLEPYSLKDVEKTKISDSERKLVEAEKKSAKMEEELKSLKEQMATMIELMQANVPESEEDEDNTSTTKRGKKK